MYLCSINGTIPCGGFVGLTWAVGGSTAFLILHMAMITLPPYEDEFDKYDEPRLHMERLMKVRLVEFDLSLRILIPLEKAGINTLGDLCKQSPSSLRKIRQLGKLSVDTLEALMDRLALSFAVE